MSRKLSDGMILIGFGVLGYVHEFVISNEPEIFPTILFGLMLAKGFARIFEKTT